LRRAAHCSPQAPFILHRACADAPPHTHTTTRTQATRQRDETELNLEEGQRVFLHVPAKNMMAFEQPEIESTPVL
jgi:hypothetical protein